MQVLLRFTWDGTPKELGEVFRLCKAKGTRELNASCRLWTHQLGWELRLGVERDLVQSQVCRSQDDVLTTGEQWKAASVEKGWS